MGRCTLHTVLLKIHSNWNRTGPCARYHRHEVTVPRDPDDKCQPLKTVAEAACQRQCQRPRPWRIARFPTLCEAKTEVSPTPKAWKKIIQIKCLHELVEVKYRQWKRDIYEQVVVIFFKDEPRKFWSPDQLKQPSHDWSVCYATDYVVNVFPVCCTITILRTSQTTSS